jgi:hypothetical protein
MEIDLTLLIQTLLTVLIASLIVLAVTEIVPRVKALWKPFRDKYPFEAVFLEQQAVIAVNAAEQYITDGNGYDKLAYALDYIEGQAKKYGYSFDKAAVQTLIEAKVKELKDKVISSAGQK